MTTLREETWQGQANPFRTDEITHYKYSNTTNIIDPDDDDFDEGEDDEDLDYDNDLGVDSPSPDFDEDLDDLDDDDVDEDDEDDDYDVSAEDETITDDPKPEDVPSDPGTTNGETPGQQKEDEENLEYPHEAEVENQHDGGDAESASYSEQNDVTPPEKRTIPGVGPDKADFEKRPYGRTTGRMTEHEPGTEGI